MKGKKKLSSVAAEEPCNCVYKMWAVLKARNITLRSTIEIEQVCVKRMMMILFTVWCTCGSSIYQHGCMSIYIRKFNFFFILFWLCVRKCTDPQKQIKNDENFESKKLSTNVDQHLFFHVYNLKTLSL